jgi:hypothetical protein
MPTDLLLLNKFNRLLAITFRTSSSAQTDVQWAAFSIIKEPYEIDLLKIISDRLCSLVVRVLGYRSGGPGSIPGTTRKK